MDKKMEKVHISIKMVINILANGWRTKRMAKVY